MSDSSIEEDLFGKPDDEEDDINASPIRGEQASAPEYVHTLEFTEYQRLNKFEMDDSMGYIMITLNRPYFFSGQTVRGSIIIDAFNSIREGTVMFRVKGKEYPGKNAKEVVKRFLNKP